MKLRNLNGAIRKMKGAVSLTWNSPHGPVLIETGKTSLLAALKHGFNDEAMTETGLKLSEDGVLIGDPAAGPGHPHLGVVMWRSDDANSGEAALFDETLAPGKMLDEEPAQFDEDWALAADVSDDDLLLDGDVPPATDDVGFLDDDLLLDDDELLG